MIIDNDAGDLRFYKKAQTTEESTIRYVMGNQDKFLYGLVKKFLEITIVLNLQVKFIFSNLNKIKFMAVKRLMILVVPVMFSNTFFAQNTKLDSLKQKLQTDTAAFEQFVFLGKCNCIDEVIRFNNGISKKQEKPSNFDNAYNELETLNFPTADLFKKDVIRLLFQEYQKTEYSKIVDQYNEREDFYKNRTKYPLLPCDRIYTKNSELYLLYVILISDLASYSNENKMNEYLKKITYLNSEGW